MRICSGKADEFFEMAAFPSIFVPAARLSPASYAHGLGELINRQNKHTNGYRMRKSVR
jgi:hypothetical protein